MREVTLIASLLAPPAPDGRELTALPECVRWLEVRADLASDIDAGWLRSRFKGGLIYALRRRAAGGNFAGSPAERHERLLNAAGDYDLIELDAEDDLTARLLEAIPPRRRLISWHGGAYNAEELAARFGRMAAYEARLYKLVTTAVRAGDGLEPLHLLKTLGRRDVIAYSRGPAGLWGRILTPAVGGAALYGAVSDAGRDAGEPTVAQLVEDYGFPEVRPVQELCGIVGRPVLHSLSPRLHNAAYRALNCPALFLPFHVESFGDFWREVVCGRKLEELDLSLKGLTVASPHKEVAMVEAGHVSLMSRRAGATNIMVRDNGLWSADTTDPDGVVAALRERGVEIENRRAAVVGCGGAGRAAAAALVAAGAEVMLVNRGLERARHAVELLSLPFTPLADFSAEGYSIIVNATPVGRDDGRQPFDAEKLDRGAAVVDLVYGATATPLVERAKAAGLTTVDGRAVLLTQVLRQFYKMMGREMPARLAHERLGVEAADADVILAG